MRYWAVGFKDWVELRGSLKPLKEQTSEVKRSSPEKRKPYYWNTAFDGEWNPTPNSYVIKITVHIGGRILTMVPSKEFKKITGLIPPPHGKMLELVDQNMVKGLRECGRKYN